MLCVTLAASARFFRLHSTSFSQALDNAIVTVCGRFLQWQCSALPKFYLPYPDIDSAESILLDGDKTICFPTRKDALAFVMERCRTERLPADADNAVISIEGRDGLWRSFDTRLMPARKHG